MTTKTYVLDTNVLLSDASALYSFDEHNVVIPMIVLEELDRIKSRPDEVGRNARQVSRTLDSLRQKGNLFEGVKTPGGGLVRVATVGNTGILPEDLDKNKADNQIIAFMLHQSTVDDVTLVSKDINVRLKCDALGIRSEDYKKMRAANSPQEFYKGVEVVSMKPKQIDELFQKQALQIEQKFFENQIVVVKSTDRKSVV